MCYDLKRSGSTSNDLPEVETVPGAHSPSSALIECFANSLGISVRVGLGSGHWRRLCSNPGRRSPVLFDPARFEIQESNGNTGDENIKISMAFTESEPLNLLFQVRWFHCSEQW